MRKISLLFVIITSLTFGQKRGHNPIRSVVEKVYFNKDLTMFMTKSLDEVGLWDATTKQPIWIYEANQFGCNCSELWILKPSPDLNYFSVGNYYSCKKLVNTKTLVYEDYNEINKSKLGEQEDNLIKDYEITYEFKGNNEIAYLTDAKGKKKQIYKAKKFSYGCSVYENQVFINIGTKIERYDISSEKWDEIPFATKSNDKVNLLNNVLYCNYLQYNLATNTVKPFKFFNIQDYRVYGNNLFWMKNLENKFFLFNLETEIESEIELHHKNDVKDHIKYVSFDSKQKKIYFIENDRELINNNFLYKYYLTSYSSETGKYLESILLTDIGMENVLAQRKAYDEAREKREDEERKTNTPENRLRIRLSNLYNQKFINATNKRIYQVVPDKPMYEGNLVRLNALHYDKTKIEEVYERIENLENPSKYTTVQQFGKCNVCLGEGVTHKSGTSTVADYEYTLGVKVVKTTTTSTGCQQCGGCGLIQK